MAAAAKAKAEEEEAKKKLEAEAAAAEDDGSEASFDANADGDEEEDDPISNRMHERLLKKQKKEANGDEGDEEAGDDMDEDAPVDDAPLAQEALANKFEAEEQMQKHVAARFSTKSVAAQETMRMFGVDVGDSSDEELEGVRHYMDCREATKKKKTAEGEEGE
jgi:hypothetical protein